MTGCPTPRKVRYASRLEAKRARRRAHCGDGRLRAYRCVCGSFHLGHLPDGAILRSRSEHFDGVKPEKRPAPVLVARVPEPKPRVREVVISAHEFFALRLCDHPRCGHEQPCPAHPTAVSRRAA